jgi:hypothetical protein
MATALTNLRVMPATMTSTHTTASPRRVVANRVLGVQLNVARVMMPQRQRQSVRRSLQVTAGASTQWPKAFNYLTDAKVRP